MKYVILTLALCVVLMGCQSLQKSWVEQDRDNFGVLDEYGIDKMIDDAAWIAPDEKQALHAMNKGRRVRIDRGCELVGVTPSAGIREGR